MEKEKPTIGGIYQTNVLGGGDMWQRVKILKYPLPIHYQYYGIKVDGSAIVDLTRASASQTSTELK